MKFWGERGEALTDKKNLGGGTATWSQAMKYMVPSLGKFIGIYSPKTGIYWNESNNFSGKLYIILLLNCKMEKYSKITWANKVFQFQFSFIISTCVHVDRLIDIVLTIILKNLKKLKWKI